jgi:hypothetical protein
LNNPAEKEKEEEEEEETAVGDLNGGIMRKFTKKWGVSMTDYKAGIN